MSFFDKEEVYIGYSLRDLSAVRDSLSQAGIRYAYKVVSRGGWGRGRFGSVGVNMDYEKQYIVSVKRAYYEQAMYLVNKALHP